MWDSCNKNPGKAPKHTMAALYIENIEKGQANNNADGRAIRISLILLYSWFEFMPDRDWPLRCPLLLVAEHRHALINQVIEYAGFFRGKVYTAMASAGLENLSLIHI